MPEIKFVQSDGKITIAKVDAGQSLMIAAVLNDVAGIIGECGGCCVCGTCHVHFSEDDFARLPQMGDAEDAVLDSVDDRVATSRLACQIEVSAPLNGLTVLVG